MGSLPLAASGGLQQASAAASPAHPQRLLLLRRRVAPRLCSQRPRRRRAGNELRLLPRPVGFLRQSKGGDGDRAGRPARLPARAVPRRARGAPLAVVAPRRRYVHFLGRPLRHSGGCHDRDEMLGRASPHSALGFYSHSQRHSRGTAVGTPRARHRSAVELRRGGRDDSINEATAPSSAFSSRRPFLFALLVVAARAMWPIGCRSADANPLCLGLEAFTSILPRSAGASQPTSRSHKIRWSFCASRRFGHGGLWL
mmetsp:Transcript_23394/g.58091  ORF Transcript_23394/g.58091 Transcript_23394/m.58091 type:complete len:255 (+) Transcript_23394:640-1404(+)